MAVQKNITNTSLVMEVSTGTTDEKGNTIYKNKTFSNISLSATSENIYVVAQAIASVLSEPAGFYYLKDTSELVDR